MPRLILRALLVVAGVVLLAPLLWHGNAFLKDVEESPLKGVLWIAMTMLWIVWLWWESRVGTALLWGFRHTPEEGEETGKVFTTRWLISGRGKEVSIWWRMAEVFPALRLLPNKKTCRLLGYRTEKQFNPEEYMKGGLLTLFPEEKTWIADGSKDSGFYEEELEAGKRYYYIFFARAEKKGKVMDFDRVTFSVKLPKGAESSSPPLSTQAKRTEEEVRAEQKAIFEREIQEDLDRKIWKIAALQKFRTERTEAIKAMKLPAHVEEKSLEDLERICEQKRIDLAEE